MLEPIFKTSVIDESDSFAQIIIEPLHASFGQSLGNALRRTLLSSLSGSVISYVRFEQANHLFTTVDGVKESLLDIVLNLKQVRFYAGSDEQLKVNLSKSGSGIIYAKDIVGEAKVVNENHYIAELTTNNAKLDFTAIVETGIGYVSSEEKEDQTGYIQIDSSFSPVRLVNFKVEEARVGRKSNFEKLILEITTDASIKPSKALEQAQEILIAHFKQMFSTSESAGKLSGTGNEETNSQGNKKYEMIIDELNLPSRVINALLRENIETVGDLVERGKDNLVGLKGVGRKSIDLVEDELEKMGVEI